MAKRRKTKIARLESFARQHWASLKFYDYLVNVIVQGERTSAFHSRFNHLTPEKGKAFQKLKLRGEELWKWLEANGYQHVVDDMIVRQCVAALITDACHFILESLKAASKNKLAVAFTLARKPFKDNLVYLEWVATSPNEFVANFKLGGQAVDASQLGAAKKKALIEQTMTLRGTRKWIDPHFIFEVRFDSDCYYGLEWLWNQATHLVTTKKSFPTSPCNFNFVFSDVDDMFVQKRHYYLMLPALLMHFVNVVDQILLNLRLIDEKESKRLNICHSFHFLRASPSDSNINQRFNKQMRKIGTQAICPSCVKPFFRSMRDLRIWNETRIAKCAYCGFIMPEPS